MGIESRESMLIPKCQNDEIGEELVMKNRCKICGLWNITKTDICPECNGIMDLSIEGMSLSWKCRKCDYGIAITANKLCFWDEKKYARDCYEKISECPYAEQ